MQEEASLDPDWSEQLTITLSAGNIAHTLFASAAQVHTGWDSCVEPELCVFELNAVEHHSSNHCRLVELEYEEDDQPGVVWHDWTVELKIGEVYLSAHWRAPISAPGSEWDWCAEEARKSFDRACVLIGKRVTTGVAIEEMPGIAPETRH